MALSSNAAPFERGATFLGGRTAEGGESVPVGQDYEFPDDRYGTKRTVRCRLVKNTSGVTVLPGTLVLLNTLMTECIGVVNHEYLEGPQAPVDDHLGPNGVPTGDWFYIVTRGPNVGKNQIAEHNDNIIDAGERIRATTVDAATTAAVTVGRIQAVEVTSSVTVAQNELRSVLGRAVTAAATSGVTDTDLLVDWDIDIK